MRESGEPGPGSWAGPRALYRARRGAATNPGSMAAVSVVNRRWFAIIVPALLGFGLAALCVRGFRLYGWSLFLGLPVVVCFLSAFCTSFRRVVSIYTAYGISVLSLLWLGGFILLFALDGLYCLLMAFPLAALLGTFGAFAGWRLGMACRGGLPSTLPLIIVALFPGLVA